MPNHTFKTNFIDLPKESASVKENYDYASNVRNVVFVLSNGSELMRNYAYLVGVDLLKEGGKNVLEVGFTSDTILIEGYRLILLRDLLKGHIPKNIVPNSLRYKSEQQDGCFIIAIQKK